MIPIDKIEASMMKKFFDNVEIENEIIDAVFNCVQYKGYLLLLKKYGFSQMKDICMVDFSSGVNGESIFRVLKPLPDSISFI